MPLTALESLCSRLEWCFYSYGKACAARPLAVLTLSLAVVCFLSWPNISGELHTHSLDPSLATNTLDAQEWIFSPHLLPSNATSSTKSIIAQQIRVMNLEQRVTMDLIRKADILLQSLLNSRITVAGKLTSLRSICLRRRNECVIHSPLDYWENRSAMLADPDWKITVNRRMYMSGPSNGLSLHPLALFGNVSLDDHDQFQSADAIFINVLIEQGLLVEHTWEALWDEAQKRFYINQLQNDRHPNKKEDSERVVTTPRQKKLMVKPKVLRYKFKLFPDAVLPEMYFSLGAYIFVFFIVMYAFWNTTQIKSCIGLGISASFVSLACYTTTIGIYSRLKDSMQMKPWYLAPLIIISVTIENVFLLTNAVLSAGRDKPIHEKIGFGLKTVGGPISIALSGELVILAIGSATDIHCVSHFCRFVAVTLLVEYLLQFTFFTSILSIAVKRTELADMSGSKHMRREQLTPLLGGTATDFTYPSLRSPLQTKCDVKRTQWNVHSALNALMLCFIALALGLSHSCTERPSNWLFRDDGALFAMSAKFWQVVNPTRRDIYLLAPPPYLVVFSQTPYFCEELAQHYEAYYAAKEEAIQAKTMLEQIGCLATDQTQVGTIIRILFENTVQRLFLLAIIVNTPLLLLLIVFGGIIMWISHHGREQWLKPVLKKVFATIVVRCLHIVALIPPWKNAPFIHRTLQYLHDRNGEDVHYGAISVQKEFNEKQIKYPVTNVKILTLSGKHTSDINCLDINGKYGTAVSCSQDGRLVQWSAQQGDWKACLDPHSQISCVDIGNITSPNFRGLSSKDQAKSITASYPLSSMARCVKIDQYNKWIAAGFDDGSVRIWRTTPSRLIREFFVGKDEQVTMEGDISGSPILDTLRTHSTKESGTSIRPPNWQRHRQNPIFNRVVALEFISSVAYEQDSIAEKTEKDSSVRKNSWQNQIVSVHKDGILREWDIDAGTRQNSFHLGHASDITGLRVVERQSTEGTLSVTRLFTTARDGSVKCWSRKLPKETEIYGSLCQKWTCIYQIRDCNKSAITAIAAEQSIDGMSVLATGSSDGAIRLWDLDTGVPICTLSESANDANSYSAKQQEEMSRENKSVFHNGAVTQVVLTRCNYSETCPLQNNKSDTCLDHGLYVASCSVDDTVHAWQLKWTGNTTDGTKCSHFTKRRQRRFHKWTLQKNRDIMQEGATASVIPLYRQQWQSGQSEMIHRRRQRNGNTFSSSTTIIPDNRQTIACIPTYLGKIDQTAGRGLAFCGNVILAGVRLTSRHISSMNNDEEGWEVWFAPLQYAESGYFKPAVDGDKNIHVQTFDLSLDTARLVRSSRIRKAGIMDWLKTHFYLGLKVEKSPSAPARPKVQFSRPIHLDDERSILDDDEKDNLNEEATSMLPFSTIRYVVPLDKSGFGCDYGNFIKLILLEEKL